MSEDRPEPLTEPDVPSLPETPSPPETPPQPTDASFPPQGVPAPVAEAPAAPENPPQPQAIVSAIPPAAPVWPRVGAVLSGALDLVTQARISLRDASLYIGALIFLTVGPVAAGLVADGPRIDPETLEGLSGWTALAGFIAFLAVIAIGIEAQVIGLCILAGARIGAPMTLLESLRRSRQVFWTVFRAAFLVGIVTGVLTYVVLLVLAAVLGDATDAAQVGGQLVVGVLTAPFVYVSAGIVLGDVQAVEAIRRSIRLARARFRLAVVASLFAVIAQYLLVFALSAGIDLVSKVLEPFHAEIEHLDAAQLGGYLVITAAALVALFAYGTLSFVITALSAAPQVVAFLGLTGYSRGLDRAREVPAGELVRGRPGWVSPVMIVGAAIAWICAVFAVAGAFSR